MDPAGDLERPGRKTGQNGFTLQPAPAHQLDRPLLQPGIAATVGGERLGGQRSDRSCRLDGSIEHWVVNHDQLVVARHMDIEFNALDAQLPCLLEAAQAVLRPQVACATMAEIFTGRLFAGIDQSLHQPVL